MGEDRAASGLYYGSAPNPSGRKENGQGVLHM